jgi:hypothetical protein
MHALRIFTLEHRIIEDVLEAFEIWAGALVQPERPDAASGDASMPSGEQGELLRFLTFIHHFVDAHHHHREQSALLRILRERRLTSPARATVASLLAAQSVARTRLAFLEPLARSPAAWTPAERRAVVDAVRCYAALTREHLEEEEKMFDAFGREPLVAEVFRDSAGAPSERVPTNPSIDELAAALLVSHPVPPHAAAA